MALRPKQGPRRRSSRRGFSLVELLVVMGIVVVLLAVLLPVLSGMRGAARRTVCASRLRDLSLACIQYRNDYQRLPEGQSSGLPQQLELRLLNQLAPYLRYPLIDASDAARRLPLHVQCPFVEEVEVTRGPMAAAAEAGGAAYYTGYMYLAGLERFAVNQAAEAATPEGDATSLAVLLKPERTARVRDTRRALIWADDLHLTLAPNVGWHHAHPFGSQVARVVSFAGQHRAYNDASVEWQPKEKLDVSFDPEQEKVTPRRGRKKLREAASYVVSDTYYWW